MFGCEEPDCRRKVSWIALPWASWVRRVGCVLEWIVHGRFVVRAQESDPFLCNLCELQEGDHLEAMHLDCQCLLYVVKTKATQEAYPPLSMRIPC